MAKVEPATYRIVNVGHKTAITVPAENNNTVVTWEISNQSGQQWLVRCSGGNYHISNVYGRYISVDSATSYTVAYLGSDPTLWEIVPAKEGAWKIKLVEHDLALDSYGSKNGDVIKLQDSHYEHPDRVWRFEKLGDLPNDEPEPTQYKRTDSDSMIAQMVEQLAEKDKQLAKLAGQLVDQNQRIADQNQRIADQNQRIADQTQRNADQNQKIADQNQRIADQQKKITNQEGEIFILRKQIEEKDQELAQATKEVKYLLARATQREEPVYHARLAGGHSSSAGERVQEEVIFLRDEMERLKGLVNQLIDKDNMMPNHMS